MKVGGGRTFTVAAKGLSREAKYVKGVTLDGRPYNSHFLYGEPPFDWAKLREWIPVMPR